jgi:hypothetical protein
MPEQCGTLGNQRASRIAHSPMRCLVGKVNCWVAHYGSTPGRATTAFQNLFIISVCNQDIAQLWKIAWLAFCSMCKLRGGRPTL